MNNRTALYMQAIRGPVLLVTVGALFAIHQANILSFSRTWPLLIIVIGVMKLLERTAGPHPQWQDPRQAGYQAPGSYQQPPYTPPYRQPGTSQSQSNTGVSSQNPGGPNA